MTKVVSIKKRAANRRNAQRSTGPKSDEGKNAVKWNALKHGLLAKAAVLPQEDRAEYERLWAGLVEDCQPVGTLEAILVEDIAAICWRRRRAVRAEAANIEWDTTDARDKMHSIQAEIRKAEAERDTAELQGSVAGLERLGEVFDGMARELRHDGKLSEESIAWLEARWQWSAEDLDALRGATTVTEAAKKELLKVTLEFIAETQKEFRREKKVVEAPEAALRDLVSARANILENSTGEAILRYEGAMDKKLYAAIAQLERLQKQRRGETVPPAIRVDVTKTG